MYIQNSKIMGPSARIIKPYACSIIATEGPNILSKIDLAGVEIPFETQFTTRIVLNPNTVDQPLHGYFDDNVTYLLLKVTYDETTPDYKVEENQYIEYYFNDDPIKKTRYINKLMILSGNSLYKVPRLFFNNPTSGKVVIDAMIGNVATNPLSTSDVNNTTTLNNLYHNSLISNLVYDGVSNNSGSTQLQVIDYNNNILLYLDYNSIDTITVDKTNFDIIIVTKSLSNIHLLFLSQFEMYQALSRLEWVLESKLTRILTTNSPTIDTESPIIQKTTAPTIIDGLYMMPIITSESTFVITKDDILTRFILSINDNRDGDINIYDSTVTIRKYNELLKLDNITEDGVYDILISISDIANNTTNINFLITVDNTKPEIIFNVSGTTFTMSIGLDSSNPSIGITGNDIKLKSISEITDNLSTILGNIYTVEQLSGITYATCTVSVTDNSNVIYTNITSTGVYNVAYTVTDLSGNIRVYYKTLNVV